jgi:hypothetical protein
MMKTHQINRRQSCREYRAFEARDVVALLLKTRTRQMQRCKKKKKTRFIVTQKSHEKQQHTLTSRSKLMIAKLYICTHPSQESQLFQILLF